MYFFKMQPRSGEYNVFLSVQLRILIENQLKVSGKGKIEMKSPLYLVSKMLYLFMQTDL